MAHRADGRCVFLNDENRCRIHGKFGEPAKPRACRLYPFVFNPAGDEFRVDIRFDCPEVANNRGRPMTDHRKALRELLPVVAPVAAAELAPPPYLPGVPAEWGTLLRITDAFTKVMQHEKLDLTRRIACAVNLTAALDNPGIPGLDDRKLDDLLRRAMSQLEEAALADPLPRVSPPGIIRATFRQILAVYGRRDGVHEKPRVWQRLTNSLRMVRGRGTVPPLRKGLPAVDFAALEEPFGVPGGEAAAMLVRYYRLRLWSLGFCGRTFYGRSFLQGLNMLWLTYPAILWFARRSGLARYGRS